MIRLEIARYLLIGAVGLALFFFVYAMASAPTRVASRLRMRGWKRRRAIESSGGWGQIEPVVRWLGVRVSGILSDDMYARLDEQIALAGDYLGLTPEEYVSLSLVSAVGFGLAGGASGVLLGNSGTLFLIIGVG